MKIQDGDLEAIQNKEERFLEFLRQYSRDVFFEAKLYPVLSDQRMLDAHRAWCLDLDRVGKIEPELEGGLDHFKRCGHLTYWIRRASPLIDAEDIKGLFTFPGGDTLTKDQTDFRELLFAFGNEYLAFDLGYQFCKFFENDRKSPRAASMIIPSDYIETMCHFLKVKNVSPHALFLVYKSLFHG